MIAGASIVPFKHSADKHGNIGPQIDCDLGREDCGALPGLIGSHVLAGLHAERVPISGRISTLDVALAAFVFAINPM